MIEQSLTGENLPNLAMLCRVLESTGDTLAVAESVTVGHVQTLMGSVSGIGKVFAGGITTYWLEHKVEHLGVDRSHCLATNGVSGRIAEEMAAEVRNLFNVSIGLSTTGYAEPSLIDNVEAPFAFVAVNIHGWSQVWHVDGGPGSRIDVQKYIALKLIEKLTESLLSLPSRDELPESLERLREVVSQL